MPPPACLPYFGVRHCAKPCPVWSIFWRGAVDIEVGYIDDCVALNWLEWHGGALRLTTTGDNVCKQLIGRLE